MARGTWVHGVRRSGMKIFFYMGRNPRNKSGVSWKFWKIERRGKRVRTWWGPAVVVKRKVVPRATLQTRSWVFSSEAQAMEYEALRVRRKEAKGYERSPRRRR